MQSESNHLEGGGGANPTSQEQQTSVNLQDIHIPSQNYEFQGLYDHKNQSFLTVNEAFDHSEAGEPSGNQIEKPKLILFDSDGKKIETIDISTLLQGGENVPDNLTDHFSEESEHSKVYAGQRFSDNQSILRFIKGNKSKGLEISSSGFGLKISKSKNAKTNEEELVLTNMAFYSGLHLWEIHAPISCNNIHVGVYNPVTKEEVLASFKTTTPRVITICLDLNDNQLKFWLNDRRNTGKNLKLTPGGPWIPCVKISVEKNKVVLNPYAREPTDFYEKDFDKKFNMKKYLMPHLFNMICVTKLPQVDSQKQASQYLKEQLKLSSQNIRTILMPHVSQNDASTTSSLESDTFCFIQFHYVDAMADFIQKNKDSTFKVYQPLEIAEWFENAEISSELKDPFKIISEHIQILQASQDEALNAINAAYQKLIVQREFINQDQSHINQINIQQQPFTDKIICVRDQQSIKIATRDPSTQQFDIYETNFNECPTALDQLISFKIDKVQLQLFIQAINWSSIFKENNDLINGIVASFFNSLKDQTFNHGSKVFIKVPLRSGKFFIEVTIQHMRSQLDRMKRQYQNYQTIVPGNSLINKNKPEQAIDLVKNQAFYRDPNLSVDELYLVLHLLYDIQEQMWAQTKSSKCPPEVKNFFNSVSRPYSAFNRLGSFINWGIGNVDPVNLANEGFYLRDNHTLCSYDNPNSEITELSEKTLLDQNILSEILGKNNRQLTSLVNENIPIHKSLNYFAPEKIANFLDAIASQNNDFLLIGTQNGSVVISNSSLQITSLKTIFMFSNDMDKKVKYHSQILEKIQKRIQACEDYKVQNARKAAALSLIKDIKMPKPSKQDRKEKIKLQKESKPKKGKKGPKEKSVKPQAKGDYAEDAVIGSLFGDEELKQQETAVYETNVSKQQSENCKVIGYFLLSKPAYVKCFDPLTVGCLFYSSATQKFYIRVRKLMFTLQYLHNFIQLDPISGVQVNKITGKQILNSNDAKSLFEEILNSKENIVDLYSVFLRTQVIKKDWQKKDYKFSVFSDLSEDEIEIENCKNVIDFTKCSFSIVNQGKIHVLIETTNNKTQLVQFYIRETIVANTFITNVRIEKGKEMELDKTPSRVFQFEDKILLVGQSFYHILSQESFRIEQDQSINTLFNQKKINILNLSSANKIFNNENLKHYSDDTKVPQQNWVLTVNNIKEETSLRIPLTSYDQTKQGYLKQKTELADEIDLKQCSASDIVQIGNLLQSKYEGIVAHNQPTAYLSSSGFDQNTMAKIKHTWHIINQDSDQEFRFVIPQSTEQAIHLKQIDFEFSFRRKVVKPVQFAINEVENTVQRTDPDLSTIKRLPLTVESLTGAQINDIVQPFFLTTPDYSVFSSNYPQPEFIFRLQSNKLFIPTQVIVKSKENREYNGIPISQGLIFVSDSLEDLMNTKQFSKFTLEDYKKWKKERDSLKQIPLLPNEPIEYFAMDAKTEIIIDVHVNKPIRFVKFIPTAFRKKPINFGHKPFHSNQAECQFFGVNGYEVQEQYRGSSDNGFQELNKYIKNDQRVNAKILLDEKQIGRFGEIEDLVISEIRSAKSHYHGIPITALTQLQVPNIIGVSKLKFPIREAHCDSINDVKIFIPKIASDEWEIQSVSVAVESYTDSSTIFTSDVLTQNKVKLRHYLLDIHHFPKLLKQLIEIAQDDSLQSDELKVACIQCILNFVRNNSQDENIYKFLELFTQSTKIEKLLHDKFLDQSLQFQSLAISYLEKIGLLKTNSDFLINNFIKKQIEQLFDQSRPIEKVKLVFDMLELCPQERKTEIYAKLVDLLLNRLCSEELPKYQTPEYVTLRSKYGINSFPFDEVATNSQAKDTLNKLGSLTHSSQHLNYEFEIHKYNSLYQYNFDLKFNSLIHTLKLFFEPDSKNMYKICIRLIVPDQNGNESMVFCKVYDENVYSQLCEKGDNQDILKYFGSSPVLSNEKASEDVLDTNALELNALKIDLQGLVGRFFKLQIELLDSYKSVHKNQSITSNFIRPQLIGQVIDTNQLSEEELAKLKGFRIAEKDSKNSLSKKIQLNGQYYNLFSIPNDTMCSMHKACLISVNNGVEEETKEEKKQPETSNTETVTKLNEERDKLQETLRDSKLKVSKTQLKSKVSEISSMASKITSTDSQGKLSLKYLLNLGDSLAHHILDALQVNPDLLKGYNTRDAYLKLFKHFTVYDQKSNFPHVQKMLEFLFERLEDKSKFVCYLFKEFVAKSDINYSLGNVLQFIKEQQSVDFNQLIQNFIEVFNIDQGEKKFIVVESEENIEDIRNQLQQKIISETIPIQSIIAFLTIVDDLKIDQNEAYLKNLRVVQLFQLLIALISKCPQLKDCKNQQGLIGLQYIFKVLSKFFNYLHVDVNQVITQCQDGISTLLILALQRNDKAIDKCQKQFLTDLSKGDQEGKLTQVVNALLQWYKNKDNIQNSEYYSRLDQEQHGLGAGLFYKHLSQVFKHYVRVLQAQKKGDEQTIENAYKELINLMNDLLAVLIVDQDQQNYEQNYSVVWLQIYKSIGFLIQHNLHNQSMVELLTSQFYKLRPLYQEILYPKFHHITEKLIEQSKQKDPLMILVLLKPFLFQGFENPQNLKIAYCFCDGLLNIIQTFQKEKSSQTGPISCKFTNKSIYELSELTVEFLNQHVNYGVYSGVIGSLQETIMRLDIGNQLASILQFATVNDNAQIAFTQFIKSESPKKIDIIRRLLQWIFINYNGQKGKNSPAGQRIFSLSTKIEAILSMVSESQEAVTESLPILMKSILTTDYKLRDLIQANQINHERAISIQRTVNTLFLSFFKSWVQTDGVAKKYLTELNGFDFLLDRLFSKSGKEENKQSPEKSSAPGEILFTQDDQEDQEDDDEDDQIMSLVIKKLQEQEGGAGKGKQATKDKKPPQKKQPSLPIMKKDTGIFDDFDQKAVVTESQIKEVEQKLMVDDWAKNLKIIWSSDKQKAISSAYVSTQWHKFKNGTKNRLFNYQISDKTHEYEYVMQFDMETMIQINEIQVGILYNWSTYDPDCQYEPLSFILEGGKTQETMDWRVLMYPLQDDGFKMNSITVYGYSFTNNSYAKSDSIEKTLSSIGCRECKYLTMRLRKPIMSCLDQSLYIACASKVKSYGISYISVMGTQVTKPSSVYSYLIDLQKENSLEVLSKFFSSEFTEAFEIISEQESIIDKIKNAFDKLAVLLNSKASLIKPIFLAICSKNKDLGDWIMMNRLISLDPNFIKKEQIIFLGDIISSNREKQLQKLMKLKEFLISQINKIQEGDLNLTPEQQSLMSRYVNLFNNKLREYCQYTLQQSNTEEVAIEFNSEDLDNIIALMSQCEAGNNKFFNSLTGLSLILLSPPKPLVNKTISVIDYVGKLLKSENHKIQNLLFCSILSTTNVKVINHILDQGKIEWAMENLRQIENFESTEAFQFGQIIFNSSKQQIFRDKYRESLTFELYNLLKNPSVLNNQDSTDTSKILRENISNQTISLFVQSIRDIVLGGEKEMEKLSTILKEDMVQASERGDVDFINKVIVPILHAEEKVPITISIIDKGKKEKKLEPIFAGSENQGTQDNFFLKTDVLNKKQKETFQKMFKEITENTVENFQKMQESKWELIFEDKAHQNQNPGKFKKFVQSVSNKANIIILVGCKVQEQQVVFGGFTNKSFPSLGESWAHEFDYQVPFSEANFVFHYTPDKLHHFNMTHNKPFGYIYTDYEEGGALSVSGDFFLISWSYEFQNSCGNIYDMKCIEEPSVMSFYNNMEIQHIEVWHCNVGSKSTISEGKLKSELKKNQNFKQYSPFNFFRENLVFEVSKNMTLSHLAREILGKNQVFIKYPSEEVVSNTAMISEIYEKKDSDESILDLVIIKEDQTQQDQSQPKPADAKQAEEDLPLLQHNQPILKRFEDKGGIFDLIKAAKAAVKLYRSEKLREMWTLWLNEIESFSQLPSFFTHFCQDREKETIIYNLLDGQYDIKEGEPSSPENTRIITQQEELHIEMVKYAYKIVGSVFEKHEGADLREMCLKNGTFQRFIERIGQLSSEKSRKKVDKSNVDCIIQSEQSSPDKKGDELQQKKKKKEDKSKDKSKRKGVGYTTGVGTVWNVSDYLKSKEAKQSQAANIVNILKNMIKSKDWEAPEEIKNLLLESALLPTLESAFRSGSLLDMAKEYELNMAYLGFVQELAHHQTLIDLLMEIGDEYEPKQKEPIYQLLKKMGELSAIFLQCLAQDNKTQQIDEDQVKPKNLAESIQETNKIVQEKVKIQTDAKQQQTLADILSKPLSEAYLELLSPLRFEYMNMKNSSGIYNHAYIGELPKGLNPPVSKLVRLAQEIADLSNSLPCDHTNAIFCRVDKERVDVMKCLIMGASGTPYAHGSFIYDLFFENSYPNSPPKCQLVTTGGQTVRFNPNLYNNGKVCLSLLGTWRGQSTENWDPKLSTILQVLLSIQAIIMSNEVYFNEPGYEHEAGTPDGERKNEGYANIVRYCNIKFAIIDAIKNPPPGFEKVIRRSYYLKKNEILREVKEWVDRSKVNDALYTGLVYDHNYTWAPQISQEGKYAEMMDQIYKELKETLESIPSPFEDEATGQKIERKFSANVEEDADQSKVPQGTVAKIEDIDVSYDTNASANQLQQSININDDKVKDRWSRYIGAMGIEAVAKQAESRVLLSGLGPLGIEIAKNIVLAGCKELILFDDVQPIKDELCGQFFISENDVNSYDFSKTRAECSKNKLQELNFYVKVSVLDLDTKVKDFLEKNDDIKVVVLADLLQYQPEDLNEITGLCRKKKIPYIMAYQNGLFSKIFNDFGQEFIVMDKDGEDLQEVMIKDISYNEEKQASVVTLLDGFKHKYEDGDSVILKEVLGMQKIGEEKGINDTVVTIKVINPSSFIISEDVRQYTPYTGNGTAKQIKVPKKAEFKSLQECEEWEKTNEPEYDMNLYISDFEKIDNKRFAHYIYKAFMKILSGQEIYDETNGFQACEQLFKCAKELAPQDLSEAQLKKFENMTYIFALTYRFSFPPIAAFIGGIVAQEIVKAITQKYMPIKQYFYFDCAELYFEEDIAGLDDELKKELAAAVEDSDKYFGLRQCIGEDLFDKIRECKLFMIGAGAIGCELLKNYAMLGLGTKGQIILTDPDVIEVSNLNRQFLFREKHLRKPKSQTAAAAAIQMNPDLKVHVQARLDKIHDGTSHIYNEKFFSSQTIVTNALDNIQARLYIDGKCVSSRTPLIDSGTLGPKGHVQIIIPHMTESYASQNDPEDNTEIPHCTLKMFPEETLHCVEWAKDIFGNFFTLRPQSFNKVVIEEADQEVNFSDQQEKAALKKVIKMIEKKPNTFEDCLKIARNKFQKHFYNDIKQLLHVYPLDKMTKEGRPFWSLPKRPPHPIVFDKDNLMHASVVAAYACLFAKLFSIKIPYDQPRSKEAKLKMAEIASTYEVAEFKPNDAKANEIASQVEKEQIKGPEEAKEEEEVQSAKVDDVETLKKKFNEHVQPLRQNKNLKLQVEEFEKDKDENFHIDFIHAMANIRASNYKLEEMEWINVKIKAGRIVPALATTTAAIAALQTIELIKYLKGIKIGEHRNSFLNLAVPSLMMSEPGAAIKTKLREGLEVTLWDRWTYETSNKEVTLSEVVKYLEEQYKLTTRDIFYGSIPLMMHALHGKDNAMKQEILNKPLIDLTHNKGKEGLEFIDLTITFADESIKNEDGSEKILEGVPPIRVVFKK